MEANALYQKLNRSLLCEIFISLVPLFCIFVVVFIIETVNPRLGYADLLLLMFSIYGVIFIVCSIIKLIVTLKAMNGCINYFSQNHDIEFEKKCKTARIIYILSYIIPFIPYLNTFTLFLLIYQLIMWFIVRNKIRDFKLIETSGYDRIVTASGDSESKTPMGLLIGGGIFLAIIIFGGLIGTIGLPAYHKYANKARYTDVIHAAEIFKKEIELCMHDLGTVDFAPNQPKKVDTANNSLGCSNVKENYGNGWRLVVPKAVGVISLYVKDVVIDSNGVITAFGSSVPGIDGATYQLVPYNGDKDDGTTIWKFNEEGSTCVHLGLC